MHGQEVCVFFRPKLQRGNPVGFQLHPLVSRSIFDQGLRFSSPHEASGFTSTRNCQIRGKIRGKITWVNFHLAD